MKIKYFSYIAEQSFMTSPNGERLFFHYGEFRLKPYVIPDQETEKRLFKKLLWFLRISLGGLILGQPFLFMAIPNIVETRAGFVIYLVAVLSVSWVINWLIFRTELSKLKRVSTPISLPTFYRASAKRDNTFRLILGLLGCMAFIWAGSWMIRNEFEAFVGWISVIFGGLCALAWGYTLFLKLTMSKDKKVGDNEIEA